MHWKPDEVLSVGVLLSDTEALWVARRRRPILPLWLILSLLGFYYQPQVQAAARWQDLAALLEGRVWVPDRPVAASAPPSPSSSPATPQLQGPSGEQGEQAGSRGGRGSRVAYTRADLNYQTVAAMCARLGQLPGPAEEGRTGRKNSNSGADGTAGRTQAGRGQYGALRSDLAQLASERARWLQCPHFAQVRLRCFSRCSDG